MDVWSYGLVVLEMATGNRPDRSQLSQQIQQIPCLKLKKLVTACTEIEPDKRPSMQEVVIFFNSNKDLPHSVIPVTLCNKIVALCNTCRTLK